jgi:hypothetical protein
MPAAASRDGLRRKTLPAVVIGARRRSGFNYIPSKERIWATSSLVENGLVTYASAPSPRPLLTSVSHQHAHAGQHGIGA